MGNKESEQQLENKLLRQLQGMGYELVKLPDEAAMLVNLRKRLEAFNSCTFSESEFEQVKQKLKKSKVFDCAKQLRDGLKSIDRGREAALNVQLLNQSDWSKNHYQIAQQIKIEGKRKNRYDVTLLVNGLPLVQLELKARGTNIFEAFNQIQRYHMDSYHSGHGLFSYLQLFVISNGVNTRYFANNFKASQKFTFYWTDESNQRISRLEPFANVFLEREHLWKMMCQYMVLNKEDPGAEGSLMVLRPYQFHAVEAIQARAQKKVQDGGYIWHTTGAGKTLTSFIASRLIAVMPKVYKVVFVVDRKDLDEQTIDEFRAYTGYDFDTDRKVYPAESTSNLVELLLDRYKNPKKIAVKTEIIVTTIHKISNALKRKSLRKQLETIQNKRIVFVFDECHRSQFGDFHKDIVEFFTNNQVFGFTGTPILEKNARKNKLGTRTTKMLFGPPLHYYLITNAIKDNNVLPFSVEYIGRYRRKDTVKEIDIEVQAIDTNEVLWSDQRVNKIVDHIIRYHPSKTKQKRFNAIFCVQDIKLLTKYLECFQKKREAGEHDLKIATLFSYRANEKLEKKDEPTEQQRNNLAAEKELGYYKKPNRDVLSEAITDYNKLFNTSFNGLTTEATGIYRADLVKRVTKEESPKKVDILLVVDMFLTGFNSRPTNTLYVDKSLKLHGLLQAYSRTNRVLDEHKPYGNIVCFRNLKKATDEALELFSDENAKDEIFVPPYEDEVDKFNAIASDLIALTPTADSVHDLMREEELANFAKLFGALLRLLNRLKQYTGFDWEDLDFEEQEFIDFKSQYHELYKSTQGDKEKVSILHEVEFETELLQRDKINVSYILDLLKRLNKVTKLEERKELEQAIHNLLTDSEGGQWYSKQLLVQDFIDQHLSGIMQSDIDVEKAFETYWTAKEKQALAVFCEKEGLHPDTFKSALSDYRISKRVPAQDKLISCLLKRPSVIDREEIGQRLVDRLIDFENCFGMDLGEEY